MNSPRYKKPTRKSRFFVAPPLWELAIAFCRNYPLWVAELSVCDTSKTITNYSDHLKVQTSSDYNPVEEMAIRRMELKKKVDIIDTAAACVADSEIMRKFLIMGVTHHLSYETLKTQGIPCGRRQYHELRRSMIYCVSQKIG